MRFIGGGLLLENTTERGFSKQMKLRIICSLLLVLLAQSVVSAAVNVNLVTDEAEAVLAILAKKKAGESITDADWQRVFQSEGYVRLKKRETSMQRSFEDADFKTFVLSDQLAARAQALEETLARWRKADVNRSARLALAYLPKDASITAKIYPVIKPRENSFVFDVTTDPAIFLYLDPAVSREKFENTLAHELHHIGYGSTCPRKDVLAQIEKLTPNAQRVIGWTGAFGEGFAMLAAAGGPDIHPHAVSRAEERARWDKDVANFNKDLKKVDAFFTEILSDKLTADQIQAKGFSFFGVQGPWYTVGWRMSVLIEKTYGRAKLIESMCDQRQLLTTYNRAATKYNRTARQPLALWSPAIANLFEPTAATNAWKGIVPLHSTRADVKRILGTPTRDVGASSYFRLAGESVVVNYQGTPCDRLGFTWNVPVDTVVAIGVIPKKAIKKESLVREGEFKTEVAAKDLIYYEDRAGGRTIETYKDDVSLISYAPTTADEKMRCPQVENCCADLFPNFDEYGVLSFSDERARLDNFVIHMREYNVRGALVIYGENAAQRQKMLQRAERAKNYVVNVLGLESRRLLLIDGGYRNKPVTALHRYAIAGELSRVLVFPEEDR
jgi:hypothetical protein